MVIKSVLGIVFDEKKVLFVKRRDVPVWVFPGGGVDIGESPECAIIREIEEESGLKVEIIRRIGTYTGGKFIKPVHVYECRRVGGVLSSGEEVRDARYFSIEKLPKEIPPPFEEFLEDALRQAPPFERKITSITFSRMILIVLKHPIWFIRFILSRLGVHINT